MRYNSESRVARVLVNPHAVAERLAIWSEQARLAGRFERADQLLLAAWEAFDVPSVADTFGRWPDAARTVERDEAWMDKAA
jgi:hypothetical protein